MSVLLVFVLNYTINAQNLSDSIYHDLDELVAEYPSLTAINTYQLKIEENYSNLKSDEERLALVIMHCNLGYYLKEYEKHYDAIQHYRKAWSLYNNYDLANYDIIEYCLKPLGNLLTITGNFADAENIISHYMKLAQSKKNEEAYTAGVINLSVVYHNIGNFHDALNLLENHLENGRVSESQKELIQNNIATNLLALQMNEEAQKKIESQKEISISSLKNKTQLLIKENELTAARSIFKEIELLLIEKGSPRQLAKFYVEKSSFHYAQLEKDSALENLNEALSLLLPNIEKQEVRKNKPLLYPENTFIEIFDAYAQYSEGLNRKLSYYDLSFHVEDLLMDKINDPQSQLIFQTSNRKRSEKCLQLLYQEFQKSKNDALIWKALSYAEQNKARVLKGSLNKKSLIDEYPNDSLLQFQQHLLKEQQSLIGKLVRKQFSNPNDRESKLNQEFIDLSFKISETQNLINEKYPQSDVKNKINCDSLQKQLKADDAQLLYFFFGDKDLFSFRIDHSIISWKKHRIDKGFKEDMAQFIRLFESPSLINNDIPHFVHQSFKFSQILGNDIDEKHRNLIIVPDGLLSFLPFEALIREKIDHKNFSNMPFWLKENTFSYNLSLEFYQQNQKDINLESFYGAFPIYKNTDRYLKSSEKEAEMLHKKFKGKIDQNENATKANFLENADQFDVLHLSTHASGGSFTVPAYIEFIDDVLLLPELYAQNLEASLVVLSACETGVGKIIKGATPMSLARGFHFAGVQNILMTQWKVNDFTTFNLMNHFYEDLQGNQSPSLAIQNAKTVYLEDKTISNLEKSPYYWAGFTYYGKPSTEDQNEFEFRYFFIIGLIVIMIWVGFYLIRRIQKHS
ncbi:CHAT domain-containing protein [Marivirga salinae]|uniref:CHAT domain-containing protein n=1 Tax=Marivirga salinarum TaxID=3059078 RepID=A0AA51N8H5_9BACT|nr:CHAT domain-containing protein [Marivirga sp. BDSF4-3]WMN10717.1 CHAT domain-containing protein [Marivirga sp. BDSF4-3]